MSSFMVGVGQVCINPPLGFMLGGYALRPALSVNDDLQATAFAFKSGETTALLISLDVCNLNWSRKELCQAISEACGVPGENIILSCTHTHSGPTAATVDGVNFMEILRPSTAKAAAEAVANLRPARMGWGTAWSDVGVNRRQIKENGEVTLGQDPHGTWDPTMTVISFREPDGTPIGNLIHYGAHNTASSRNDEITRDWCGVAIDRLQEESGGITAFVQGCAGDCGPRLPNGRTTGNLKMALELGARAAIDAVKAWRSIRRWEEVSVRVSYTDLPLPLAKLGTPDELRARAEAMGDPETLKGWPKKIRNRLVERAEWLEEGNVPAESETIPLVLLGLGEVAVCPLPFEIFSRITLRIKEFSPFAHTIVTGHSNGSMSYFPSMDQICRGGYAVNMFHNVFPIPFADDAEQPLVQGCVNGLRALYEK